MLVPPPAGSMLVPLLGGSILVPLLAGSMLVPLGRWVHARPPASWVHPRPLASWVQARPPASWVIVRPQPVIGGARLAKLIVMAEAVGIRRVLVVTDQWRIVAMSYIGLSSIITAAISHI